MFMKSVFYTILVCHSLAFSVLAHAEVDAPPMKAEELFVRDDFKALPTPQAKLEMINKIIESKQATSSTFTELTNRLFWDDLATQSTLQAKLDRFKTLQKTYSKLPQGLYDLENGLTLAVISTPEAQKADLPTKMAMITKLQKDGILSWPGIASIQTGLLAAHLAQNPAYMAADPAGKIGILRALETSGALSSMTTAPFIKSVAFDAISQAKDNRQAVFDQLTAGVGFFAESSLKGGYLEYKK